MTNFYIVIEDGFINGIGTNGNDSVAEITESEYNDLLSLIHNRPSAPNGFTYKLKADTLTWEQVELPEPSSDDDEATESDYIEALQDLGVEVE